MSELHPAANLFPMMSKEEFEGLKSDIEINGQREPITYYDGLLLDGRNRLRACEELKVKPTRYDLPKDTDPVAWVLSHNFHRRHLNASQRSMIAARLANLPVGANQHSKEGGPKEPPSIEEAAKRMNVGISSVKRAKKIQDKGSAEVIAAVESGELKVTTAAEFVDEEPDKRQQTKIVRKGSGAVKEYITEPKDEPKRKEPEPEAETEVTDKVIDRAKVKLEEHLRGVILQFGHLGLGGQADKEVNALRKKAGL